MSDRFKCRAYITSIIDIVTPEEKEVSFYIDGVAVYEDGDIGFSRDKLLDALDKLDLTKNQKEQIEYDISENSYCGDYDWFSIEFGEKEQCTGLKDKNGKLIYEGDIVKCGNNGQFIYKIGFNKRFASFVLIRKEDAFNHYFGEAVEAEDVEIIGNIHGNAELLEQSDEQ